MVRLKNGRTVLLEQSKRVKPWREAVADAARKWHCPIRHGDVALYARVYFSRPKSHYDRYGQLKTNTPARPGRLDCDKIARSICDALTGVAWIDDRQVSVLCIERIWCPPGHAPGATLQIDDAPPSGRCVYEFCDSEDSVNGTAALS